MDGKIRPGLHLYYCGHEACVPGHSFGPAERRHYLMHFVLKGKGTYHVKGQQLCVEKGTAFLIHPQEITYYEADKQQPWEYMWIAFDGEEAERLLHRYRLEGERYLCRFQESAVDYLKKVLEAYAAGAECQEEMFGYFYLVWSCMERPREPETGGKEQDYLNRAKKYIRHHFSYPVRIEEMAHYIGIDRTYLYRIFMNLEGKSPKEYLTCYRLEEAADLLKRPGMTVTQAALSCGFYDSSSFSKQFKERKGESPRQYQARNRNA